MAKYDVVELFTELIRRAATDLPKDVEQAIKNAASDEVLGSAANVALLTILDNVELARRQSTPICQDTGLPIFTIHHPVGISLTDLEESARSACRIATQKSYLRPNAVDITSGKNSGDNIGLGFPTIYFHEWDRDQIKIDLLLKGGGSENVSSQIKLPDSRLGAGRDFEGVRKVVLDAVFQAQGKGCSPGVVSVCIGGDRGNGYARAKQELLRPLDMPNPNPKLNELEKRWLEEANQLGIGPMGLGGRTTLLGLHLSVLHRLPACYFVSVAYMCWATRRAHLVISDDVVTYY